MKKAVLITGLISTIMIVLGALFKIQHWPGAGPLIVFGVMIHVLAFLPLWMIFRVRETQGGLGKAIAVLGFLFLFLVYISILFKVMYWPGGGPMLGAAFAILLIVYLPMLLIRIKQETTRSVNLIFTFFIAVPLIIMLLGQRVPPYLNSYVVVEKRMKELYQKLDRANERYYEPLKILTAEDIERIQPYFDKVSRIQSMTNDLEQYITSLRAVVVSETEKIPLDIADTLAVSYFLAKENYDIPTYILIGEDPASPKYGQFTAKQLKEKLNSYRQELQSLVDSAGSKKRFDRSAPLQTTDICYPIYNTCELWEDGLFYHMPLASVVVILDQLKIEVKITEGAALWELYNDAIEKGVIHDGEVIP